MTTACVLFFLLVVVSQVCAWTLQDEVQALCDIYTNNHPTNWTVSPCGWDRPCNATLYGVICLADEPWNIYSLYYGFMC